MYSIYHFYKHLVVNKKYFLKTQPLDKFPFDTELLASISKGKFPDLSIKINHNSTIFTGGELIELKDSNSYNISSFNSTIPTAKKRIDSIIIGQNSIIKQQMEEAGNNINFLPIRDVFYLIRGINKSRDTQKVVLVYGSFFETITQENLISQSFLQMLEERLKQTDTKVKSELKTLLTLLFSQQKNFSKVRNIDKASVKLRFRIMTEAKAEGNILNSKKYPTIDDNTLNFIIPYHTLNDKKEAMQKMHIVFNKKELSKIKEHIIKHHLNGNFLVFQTSL